MPEENLWTLWCKGRLTEADTPTIRLGATPSGLTSAHLHHPIFLQAGCPSCHPTISVKALKATSAFGLGRRRWSSQQCYMHRLRTLQIWQWKNLESVSFWLTCSIKDCMDVCCETQCVCWSLCCPCGKLLVLLDLWTIFLLLSMHSVWFIWFVVKLLLVARLVKLCVWWMVFLRYHFFITVTQQAWSSIHWCLRCPDTPSFWPCGVHLYVGVHLYEDTPEFLTT